MSKKSKAKNKQDNLIKKRARKATNKAKYAALKLQGQNTKSTRATRNNAKNKLVKTKEHTHKCGNIGCEKCLNRINNKTKIMSLKSYLLINKYKEKGVILKIA